LPADLGVGAMSDVDLSRSAPVGEARPACRERCVTTPPSPAASSGLMEPTGDATTPHHVGPVGVTQRLAHVLLDEQHCGAPFIGGGADRFEQALTTSGATSAQGAPSLAGTQALDAVDHPDPVKRAIGGLSPAVECRLPIGRTGDRA
jgi:hypothetical protein